MRKRIAPLALALAIAALSATPARAVPASAASVETLFTVMRTDSMMGSIYGSVEQMLRQNMAQMGQGKPLTAEQQRMVDIAVPRAMALMHEEVSWEKLKPQYMQLYRETFEQEEVDGLIAFYASPAGQAFVNKMPVVLQKSLAISQGMMQSMMPKLIEVMRQAAVEAKVAN